MRKRVVVLLLVACAFTGPGPLLACGDKFLNASRGTKFQRPPGPRHPASILIYDNPATAVGAWLSKVVARNVTGAEFTRARRHYTTVLKPTLKTRQLLEAVEWKFEAARASTRASGI